MHESTSDDQNDLDGEAGVRFEHRSFDQGHVAAEDSLPRSLFAGKSRTWHLDQYLMTV